MQPPSSVCGPWLRVGREIPQHEVATPVAHRSHDQALHLPGDTDRVAVRLLNDHLLGEVQVLVRTGQVNRRERLDVAAVVMEGGAVDVLCRGRIRQDRQRVIGPVQVVIEDDDLGGESGRRERRSQVGLDEVGLLLRREQHARRVLEIERLVLDRDGVDRDPEFSHFEHVLDEVLGIGGVVFRP